VCVVLVCVCVSTCGFDVAAGRGAEQEAVGSLGLTRGRGHLRGGGNIWNNQSGNRCKQSGCQTVVCVCVCVCVTSDSPQCVCGKVRDHNAGSRTKRI